MKQLFSRNILKLESESVQFRDFHIDFTHFTEVLLKPKKKKQIFHNFHEFFCEITSFLHVCALMRLIVNPNFFFATKLLIVSVFGKNLVVFPQSNLVEKNGLTEKWKRQFSWFPLAFFSCSHSVWKGQKNEKIPRTTKNFESSETPFNFLIKVISLIEHF